MTASTNLKFAPTDAKSNKFPNKIPYLPGVKTLSSLLILFLLFATAYGQVNSDSLSQALTDPLQKVDVDSIKTEIRQLPDSLLPAFEKLDSIHNDFTIEGDSIQQKYKHVVTQIEAKRKTVSITVDSLRNVDLPANKYTRKLDSLEQLRSNLESTYKSKFDSLKVKTIGRLQSLDLPPEYKEPLQKLSSSITDVNIESDFSNIPSLKMADYSLPDMNALPDAGDIPNIDKVAKLPDVEAPVDGLDKLNGEVTAYQDDLKSITEGNVQNVEKLPETIEDQASRIDGLDELQKQSGVIDEHKVQLDKLADPENAKEKAVSMAKEKAVDHFAGKQEQLKSAMDKISKYKQKYSSVSSIKDLPKRPPNPMKDKPFIERLVPGVYLQYQQKNYYLLDINPYIGYKVSGRVTTGLGWNHRVAWDSKYKRWERRSRIFGPRGFVDFKLGKGFIAHVEGETINSFVPSTLRGNPDDGQREWVWSCMTGIKKEYRIYKNLKGTALIQYNLFNRHYKAPYVNRLNSRIGFEYVLKKKTRKQ